MRRGAGTRIAAGLAALALAGCGGDDAPIEPLTTTAEDAVPEGALSPEELAGRIDPLCGEANVAIASLQEGASADDLVSLATQERQITEGVLEAVNALPAPTGGRGPLRRYKSALRSQVRILERREQAARGGDTATYEQLGGELAQAEADARLAAEEFGFEQCGQEGDAVASDGDGSGGATATDPTPGPASGGTAPTPDPTPAPAPAPTPDPAPAPEPPDTGGSVPGGGGSSGGGNGSGGGSSGGIGPG